MSAVALPIGAVMFSVSEESVLNGSPGQWANPSALLHSSHAEPSTRPVCCVLFVLCPILPMDLGPQRCSRLKQPVRRRLTFGPSEGSACTSRPWVVMTTQIRTVSVCACVFEISVPGVPGEISVPSWIFCAQLCACSLFSARMRFSPVRTTHHGLLACRVLHCVFDPLKEGCFRSSFCVSFVGYKANLLMYLQEPPRGDGASSSVA